MAHQPPLPWPRPQFRASEQATKIFFVCFASGALADIELERARFGLPSAELLRSFQLAEHARAANSGWYEAWWGGAFGVMAARDLGDELPRLTQSQLCVSLGFEGADQPDLAPLQTAWGLARWLCERGAEIVLDVHAFRFRTRAQIEALSFAAADAERDVKIVFETEPTRDGLHLLHTRGLCKCARPELACFIRPSDAGAVGAIMDRLAQQLLEGAAWQELRESIAGRVELVTRRIDDPALLAGLGLEAAVMLTRSDGASLAGSGDIA